MDIEKIIANTNFLNKESKVLNKYYSLLTPIKNNLENDHQLNYIYNINLYNNILKSDLFNEQKDELIKNNY